MKLKVELKTGERGELALLFEVDTNTYPLMTNYSNYYGENGINFRLTTMVSAFRPNNMT